LAFPLININEIGSLHIAQFQEMDYEAIKKYNIPIELNYLDDIANCIGTFIVF